MIATCPLCHGEYEEPALPGAHGYLLELFQILEARYPPMPNGHHGILATRSGAQAKLAIALSVVDFPTFFVDPEDFVHLSPLQMADALTGLMVERGCFPLPAECPAGGTS